MPAIALKFVFTVCSIMLWRLLYAVIMSAAQRQAARKHETVGEFSRRVNWPVSGNGGRVVELSSGNQLRRRPSSLRAQYPFADRRSA
jgi:hypothetical protein